MHRLKCLGVIPARAFSKRVPGKNIKPLAEKPLISYTIEEALKASSLDRVIVSTENDEIADIAKKHNAEVPFLRPKKLAKDNVPTWMVVKHAVDYLAKEEGWVPDIIATLWCTAPFRKAEDIDIAVQKLIRSDADTVTGVCRVEDKYPYWMMKYWLRIKDHEFIPLNRTRLTTSLTKNRPELYTLNGAFVIRRRHVYKWLEKGIGEYKKEKTIVHIMDQISSIDINTQLDFILAEAVIKKGLAGTKSRKKAMNR